MVKSPSGGESPENPFPATAVAVLGQTSTRYPSIETSASSQTRAFLADYLNRSGKAKPHNHAGSVIAIVGEYGTGKTHLALSILDSIRSSDDELIKWFYLDAPADTFVALYRDRFIARLTKDEIRDLVEEQLREVLVERLKRNRITAPAAEVFRDEGIDPRQMMDQLGLIESDLMAELRGKLTAVTEREDYATALTLFLRPEFEDAVWEWLCGNPPDATLVERGITSRIDSEASVLEAMGVLAFLFGRAGRRFILLIDEMEKVLTPASGRAIDEATILAFKKLMESIGHTRSLLVLIGLPDFLEVLPEDAVQRMSTIIRPSPLSSDDVSAYIKHANQMSMGRSQLKPFSADAAAYMAEITGGNARRVVRMCFLAFQSASVSGTPVTRATIREVAREQFETASTRDAATEIARTFDSAGWAYTFASSDGRSNSSIQTYWMPVGAERAGILVMLSRSVLHDTELTDVISAADEASGPVDRADSRRILVVNGLVADMHRDTVQKAFDRVMMFSDREFRENFEAVSRGFRQQLENANTGDLLGHLAERVEQIARQLTFLVDSVERIDTRQPDVSSSAIEYSLRRAFASLGQSPAIPFGFEALAEPISQAEGELNLYLSQQPTSDGYVLLSSIRRFRDDIGLVIGSYRDYPTFLSEIERVCRAQDSEFKRMFDRSVTLDSGNSRRTSLPGFIRHLVESVPREVFHAAERLSRDITAVK